MWRTGMRYDPFGGRPFDKYFDRPIPPSRFSQKPFDYMIIWLLMLPSLFQIDIIPWVAKYMSNLNIKVIMPVRVYLIIRCSEVSWQKVILFITFFNALRGIDVFCSL